MLFLLSLPLRLHARLFARGDRDAGTRDKRFWMLQGGEDDCLICVCLCVQVLCGVIAVDDK